MNREEELFQKRLRELAKKADMRQVAAFTDFLNLNELNIFHRTEKELACVRCRSFGGYESAERQIVAFIPDALSYLEDPGELSWPIACVRIRPLHEKFAEELTHRDYLGAVLNLGIERATIGDILVDGHFAWMFCLKKMADYICGELTVVRHTQVRCEPVPPGEVDCTPRYELLRGSVASVRLDSLLALCFGSSRSRLSGLIEGGRVFVNARLVTSNGYKLKENDLISVRGMGRFRYLGIVSDTRRGRLIAEIQKYI